VEAFLPSPASVALRKAKQSLRMLQRIPPDWPVLFAPDFGPVHRLLGSVTTPGRTAVTALLPRPERRMVLGAFRPTGDIESTRPRAWTLSPSLDSFRRVFEQQ
jgi:N,N'-diacetylchitobiose transport system permease protein